MKYLWEQFMPQKEKKLEKNNFENRALPEKNRHK
jgi:hypothetical protein